MERNNTDTNTQLPTTVSIAASTVVVAGDNTVATVANGTSTCSSSTNNDSGAGISTSTSLNTTAIVGPVHQEHTLVVQMMELGIEKSLAQASVVAANYESVDAAMSLLFGDNNTNDDEQQQHKPGTTIAAQPPHLNYYQEPLNFYKVTIVVRDDLRMSPGKIAAQTCHAILAAYRTAPPTVVEAWESQGEPVIILRVQTQKELQAIIQQATLQGLPCNPITDAGRTEVSPGTVTCCAVGPGLVATIDAVTGNLSLLR